jgi:RNA polymerase sigma factor (sigma-70 family)
MQNDYDLELKCKGKFSNVLYTEWIKDYIYEIENKEDLTDFEEAVLKFYPMIVKCCGKYKKQLQTLEDFNDLLQEGFIILHNSIHTYKPIISGKKIEFAKYLYFNLEGYLQQAFNDRFRAIKLTQTAFQNKNTKYVDYNMESDKRSEVIDKSNNSSINENAIECDEIMKDLNDDDRELLNLYYFEGYSYSEIGDLKNVSKVTIGKRINKIINQIKGDVL